MEFFIDSAVIEEIKQASELGLVNGVTTNPSLVAKTGRPYQDVIREICEFVDGPVSAEALGTDYSTIMKEAREWAEVSPKVVVKIPLIAEGLKAVATCAKEGIKTNVTLCFSSMQALLAAKAGATYISPFVGRLDDIGQDGMELIREIKTIYQAYNFKTKILVASIRNTVHMREAAFVGADTATIPLKVMLQLIKHPLTDAGLETFLKDAQGIPQS